MTVDGLVKIFEEKKRQLNPILHARRMVVPIFRNKDGNGFFYSGDDRLCWKYMMSGHSSDATPEHILEAFRGYIAKDIDMPTALRLANKALNSWYQQLQSA